MNGITISFAAVDAEVRKKKYELAAKLASASAEIHNRLDAGVCVARDEIEAKFTSLSADTRERLGPGTVPGDMLIISGRGTTAIERGTACNRLTSALGLGVRQRLRPKAIEALRSIAQNESIAEGKILGHEISIALIEALFEFDEAEQTRRDGRVWRKDAHGKIRRFIPADEYTVPDLSGGIGQSHLRDLARRNLEDALTERNGSYIDDDLDIEWTEIHAPTPSIEEEILSLAAPNREARILKTVTPQLSRQEREVLDLLMEEKTAEIAKKLGLTSPTVRRVKSNIRKKISKVLKKSMIALTKSSPSLDRRSTDGKVPSYPRRSQRQQI